MHFDGPTLTYDTPGMWRSGTGTSWEEVDISALTAMEALWAESIASFGDHLYLGTGGGRLWRLGTGTSCQPGGTTMCLNRGRFRVEVEWTTAAGDSGAGQVVPVGSDDSGLFWFFDSANWEMMVKVLDGCAINERYWVFVAGATDVELAISITDRFTHERWSHHNPLAHPADAILDTAAFSSCSGTTRH